MKICIFGAGAIGGYIGALLVRQGGADVSLVARGAHLAAMKAKGLTLRMNGETHVVHPRLAEDGASLGPQDYIILTIKAHGLPAIADTLAPLIGPDTAIVYGQNGLPWWYFYKHGGPYDGRTLDSVDPGGRIWKTLRPERAIGTVLWQAAELEAPGVVVHAYGDRMPLAEPSGERTPRVTALSAVLLKSGLKAPVRPNLRPEIWLKLWGNLSFNPVSLLTGETLKGMAEDRGLRQIVGTMMEEAQTIAGALGISFPVPAQERIDMAARVGGHRTSMLQDFEAGRVTELDSLLGSVLELGQLVGIATPCLRMIYDLTAARIRTAGGVNFAHGREPNRATST
ncbi:MAG TPA: 2-dehydropantoate 2-reductase [Aestuariivirgaceae bacterium]|nr:2-dehydropantoate 2-reductase [Aestuariivirgaceae bacterium]